MFEKSILARRWACFNVLRKARWTMSRAPRNFPSASNYVSFIALLHFSERLIRPGVYGEPKPELLVSVIRLIPVEYTFKCIEVIVGEAVHIIGQQLPRCFFTNFR